MPPKIDLANKITIVVGPPDSGKSTLLKYLLTRPEYQRHLVYDPLFGFDPEKHNVIRPPNKKTKWRRYEKGNPELNKAVDKFVLVDDDKQPDYLVVDECGRLLPNHKEEGSAMGELNDFNAHYGMGVILLGQRLAQLNTDFENKATRYFVMGFAGKNDRSQLEDVHVDLPEYVEKNDDFGFTYVRIDDNSIHNFESVPEVGEKSDL